VSMRLVAPSFAMLVALGALPAGAQAPGPTDPSAPAPAPAPAPGPALPPNTIVTQGPGGGVIIAPSGPDPNAGLPSSSQPKTGNERDSFDLRGGGGGSLVLGNPGGSAVLPDRSGLRHPPIPPIHVVRHRDTLWDLSDTYYGNPWQWPRIWSMNPQVTNPHWIYPGDQLRMQAGDGSSIYDRLGGPPGSGKGGGKGDGGSGLINRRQRLAKSTVILRDQGYLGDPSTDTWGELAGASEEQMLLSEGNHVFVLLKPDKSARPGEELTLFRAVRPADKVEGARKPPGEIVKVLGTVKIESVDPKTRVARGVITESLDVIERGAKVGPVRRKFDVVPPLKSDKEIKARVLNSFYPHVYVAQDQLVFLDRGTEDGLRPGNRLVVLRRGDTWRQTLSSKSARDRVQMETPDGVHVERTPLPGDDGEFPEESVAELRVLSAERYSSLALVTQSRRELSPGDIATTRAGY
jgi:hypothetical protein